MARDHHQRQAAEVFPGHFQTPKGATSLVTTNIPAPVEVVESREQRMDRLFRDSQARREEADRLREEKKRERLADLRAAYPQRPP